eukprot:CAMPEP_0117632794 /NCGR_PEP_ID=MMETSP0802-20121206/4778_1 /TAXON_ID=38833 /ORGANISM="Micromonas sp., Strain CCMP2099" /LENGTH=457 /DNA_ID=CAMNT_0005437273 /DNA_START=181 /DNA_END=1554 /DNA_ORIENTATION=+
MATSPASSGASARLRAVETGTTSEAASSARSGGIDVVSNADKAKRQRAVGSLAHVASTALRRKNVVIKGLVAFIVFLFLSAGAVKLTKKIFFHVDVKGACDQVAPEARVAILLAGSPRAFNRTHCSFAKHVVQPLRLRGHPVDVYFSSTETLTTERERRDAEHALKQLETDHDVAWTLVDVASRGIPEPCVANLRKRYPGSKRMAVDVVRLDPVGEGESDDASSVKQESPDVIRDFLKTRRARAAADASRKHAGKTHEWIIVADPANAYGDDVPVDALCAVPGGRRAHFPWVKQKGGVNDLFAMGAPAGIAELIDLYAALCPEDISIRDTVAADTATGGGVLGAIGTNLQGMLQSGEIHTKTASAKKTRDKPSIANTIPHGVDSTERLLSWHMRKRHVLVDTGALRRFVPFTTPVDRNTRLDDRAWPNLKLGRSAFNPSQARFDEIVQDVETCGGGG